MQTHSMSMEELDPAVADFYRQGMLILNRSGLPFLVGGAYALNHYVGIERHTKDFDVFVRTQDAVRALEAFREAGFETEETFPHWLGKVFRDDLFIDIIHSSGNGIAVVDQQWFANAEPGEAFGVPVQFIPAEEMIWSKSFIMERERYDGADIAHLLLARGQDLEWKRLIERFGPHWRVLLSHLILFEFIYPGERARLPTWVKRELFEREHEDTTVSPSMARVCQGTILSREQYLVDVEQWGFQDARLGPHATMSREAVARWTAGIEPKKT